jgi:hypothetical protein
MSAYFWDFPSQCTAQMAAIITTTIKNQTCFGENLQFSFKTEGFQTQLFCWKNLQFYFKTEGITNCPIRLKQKVLQGKPSGFFSKKTEKKLNRTEGNTRSPVLVILVIIVKGCLSESPISTLLAFRTKSNRNL